MSTDIVTAYEELKRENNDLRKDVKKLKQLRRDAEQRCKTTENTLETSQKSYTECRENLKKALDDARKSAKECKDLKNQLQEERNLSKLQIEQRNGEFQGVVKQLRDTQQTLTNLQGPEGTYSELFKKFIACQRALDVSEQIRQAKDAAIAELNKRCNCFSEQFTAMSADIDEMRARGVQAAPSASPVAPFTSEPSLEAEMHESLSENEDGSVSTRTVADHPPSPRSASTTIEEQTDVGHSATSPANDTASASASTDHLTTKEQVTHTTDTDDGHSTTSVVKNAASTSADHLTTKEDATRIKNTDDCHSATSATTIKEQTDDGHSATSATTIKEQINDGHSATSHANDTTPPNHLTTNDGYSATGVVDNAASASANHLTTKEDATHIKSIDDGHSATSVTSATIIKEQANDGHSPASVINSAASTSTNHRTTEEDAIHIKSTNNSHSATSAPTIEEQTDNSHSATTTGVVNNDASADHHIDKEDATHTKSANDSHSATSATTIEEQTDNGYSATSVVNDTTPPDHLTTKEQATHIKDTDDGHSATGVNQITPCICSEYDGLFRAVTPPYGEPDFRKNRWDQVYQGNRKTMEDEGGIPRYLEKKWAAPASGQLHPDIDIKWATAWWPKSGPYNAKQAIMMFPAERKERLRLFWQNNALAEKLAQQNNKVRQLATELVRKTMENEVKDDDDEVEDMHKKIRGEAKENVRAAEDKAATKMDIEEKDDEIKELKRQIKEKDDAIKEKDDENKALKEAKAAHPGDLPIVEGPTVSTAPTSDKSTERPIATVTAPEKQTSRPAIAERPPWICTPVFIRPFFLFLLSLSILLCFAEYCMSERRLWLEANEGARLYTLGYLGNGGRYGSHLAFNTPRKLYVGGANFNYSGAWLHPWLSVGFDLVTQVFGGTGVLVGTVLCGFGLWYAPSEWTGDNGRVR